MVRDTVTCFDYSEKIRQARFHKRGGGPLSLACRIFSCPDLDSLDSSSLACRTVESDWHDLIFLHDDNVLVGTLSPFVMTTVP